MSLARLRGIVAELDAEVVLILSGRGGDLARLVDARHASLCESMTRVLDGCAWVVVPEVSYSRFGERGSIDLVGWRESNATLLVIEVKSEITSVEETLRKHDAKVRLGPAIVRDRFGWDVRATARLLVLPEHRTIRRQIEDKRAVFGRAYPDRAVAIRGWLRAPDRPLAGLMFLPDSNVGRGMRGATTRKRVRVARSSVDRDRHGSI